MVLSLLNEPDAWASWHCTAPPVPLIGRAPKQARTKELWAEAESTTNKAWDPLGVDWKTGFVNIIFSSPTFYITLRLYITPTGYADWEEMSKWESKHSTHSFTFGTLILPSQWHIKKKRKCTPRKTDVAILSLKKKTKRQQKACVY